MMAGCIFTMTDRRIVIAVKQNRLRDKVIFHILNTFLPIGNIPTGKGSVEAVRARH